ncbi:DUF1493 family protein [Acetobacteraceae bacterium]|nr:DUF1493 family protein [Acetobacteraceae bacterium]
MNVADEVRKLTQKHFGEFLDTYSLSNDDFLFDREDIFYFLNDYLEKLNVDMTTFHWDSYFPKEHLLPNFLIPKRFRSPEPEPLTVKMLIKSAEAGRWLY